MMANAATQTTVLAMGCFWCGEADFKDHRTHEKLPGILSIRVGYAGGTQPDPTYQNHEGYKEAIKITFDPSTISYQQLIDIFWKNVDPFDDKGQFCDKGFAYTSAIFFKNKSQKDQADKSKMLLEKQFEKPVKTEILPLTTFYEAEEYHQDYKEKNPVRYTYYRWNCGRDKQLQALWGKSKHATD